MLEIIVTSFFQITLGIYFGLFLFEELTAGMILFGILSQVVHLVLLNEFPFFNLGSPQFISAIGKRIHVREWTIFLFYDLHYSACDSQPLFGIQFLRRTLLPIFRSKKLLFEANYCINWHIVKNERSDFAGYGLFHIVPVVSAFCIFRISECQWKCVTYNFRKETTTTR